jgi:hypothetical protein
VSVIWRGTYVDDDGYSRRLIPLRLRRLKDGEYWCEYQCNRGWKPPCYDGAWEKDSKGNYWKLASDEQESWALKQALKKARKNK